MNTHGSYVTDRQGGEAVRIGLFKLAGMPGGYFYTSVLDEFPMKVVE